MKSITSQQTKRTIGISASTTSWLTLNRVLLGGLLLLGPVEVGAVDWTEKDCFQYYWQDLFNIKEKILPGFEREIANLESARGKAILESQQITEHEILDKNKQIAQTTSDISGCQSNLAAIEKSIADATTKFDSQRKITEDLKQTLGFVPETQLRDLISKIRSFLISSSQALNTEITLKRQELSNTSGEENQAIAFELKQLQALQDRFKKFESEQEFQEFVNKIRSREITSENSGVPPETYLLLVSSTSAESLADVIAKNSEQIEESHNQLLARSESEKIRENAAIAKFQQRLTDATKELKDATDRFEAAEKRATDYQRQLDEIPKQKQAAIDRRELSIRYYSCCDDVSYARAGDYAGYEAKVRRLGNNWGSVCGKP